ncbi:glycerate kinase type-2 family protein [Rhodovibrionaceae bacterium A322]
MTDPAAWTDPKSLLSSLFDAALGAADPLEVLPGYLPEPPKGKTLVLGAGKAAAAMAKAVEDHWQGPLEGLVVTRYDHGLACEKIEVIEAAHPVPDAAGQEAARRILQKAESLGEDDLLLCLISGGGSSLLALPAEGVSLADKQAINKALLRSGAPIDEMNCLRKHLSAIKGGRLAAAAYPARVVTLSISDVPGDDPSVIASGPTVADSTSSQDALAILEKYDLDVPDEILRHLKDPASENPKPGDRRLSRSQQVLIARPQDSLEAAAKAAEAQGLNCLILGDALEGEAREVAQVLAGIAKQVRRHGQPAAAPLVLLSGGETTVTLKGKGRGGRNAEFLLALAVALDGWEGIHAIACDTDGIDGSEDNAGAFLSDDLLARARQEGLDPKAYLADNDAYSFFQAMNELLVTGPTRTNVNDFRAILILPES